MAKAKSTTRKLSRREMVALLGSGVVLATAGGTEVEAQGNPCAAVRPAKGTFTTPSGPPRTVLVGDPCCKEGLDAFFDGYKNMKSGDKVHLKDFAEALDKNRSELLEYCVMIWGLNKEESARVADDMKTRYRTAPYTGSAPAKK
jgi:hypothetical protein